LPEKLSSGSLVINYRPAQELFIIVGGHEFSFLSTAETVGQALAEAGLPLVGLDQSSPPESAPLPQDGKIRIVRVSESVALTESSIPFGTHTEFSADLELDQQALLQGGEAGLKVARIRSRVEDGKQVSQTSDAESIVRPPKDRVMGIGTKVVIRTTEIDGDTVEYWRALTLYATPYHPCDAAGTCYYGTASGTKVRRGEVALVYPWYLLLAGERVYVPGYGFATIEDNNGANTSAYWGTYWIDLGYAQEDTIDWVNHYVTVYFLTPVPANIADLIVMP
jgi:3D (Asp-Asp-Asp) domain-containing protein